MNDVIIPASLFLYFQIFRLHQLCNDALNSPFCNSHINRDIPDSLFRKLCQKNENVGVIGEKGPV